MEEVFNMYFFKHGTDWFIATYMFEIYFLTKLFIFFFQIYAMVLNVKVHIVFFLGTILN